MLTTTTQENATFLRSHYDAFNRHDLDKAVSMVSDKVKWTNIPFDMTFDGRDGYRQYLRNWTEALPDCKVEILNMISGEEWTAVECVGRGTHDGPLVGPNGTIAPTHKKVEMKFCELFRVVEGRITEGRVYFDGTTMLRQLGVLPPTQSPNAVPAGR